MQINNMSLKSSTIQNQFDICNKLQIAEFHALVFSASVQVSAHGYQSPSYLGDTESFSEPHVDFLACTINTTVTHFST